MADDVHYPTNKNKEDDIGFCHLKRLGGGVYLLTFTGNSSHWLTPSAISSINQSLDEIARDDGACALVTTNEGKFFSNGMDVKYFREVDVDKAKEYLLMFQRLVSKLLTLCVPTIAVIRGHAVGAGFILSLAHDYRLMTSNRSYIFMNEVDLGMSLTPGNVAVLCLKLPKTTFQEAILTGRRYDGLCALKCGIVHSTGPASDELLHEGINKAMEYKSRQWKKDVYHALKMGMFRTTVHELENGGFGFARM